MGVIILEKPFLATFGVLKNSIGWIGGIFILPSDKVFRQLVEAGNGSVVPAILSVLEGSIFRIIGILRIVNPCTKDRLQQGNTEGSLLERPGRHLL